MKLYSYYRSTAAYRVRIALYLKGLSFETCPVNLLKGEQAQESFLDVNPQGRVPALEDQGVIIPQSLAILSYVDEQWPEPPLVPGDAAQKAMIRAFAATIACDVHPLNNLSVLRYLADVLKMAEAQKLDWIHHWIQQGLQVLETQVQGPSFCFLNQPTLADVFLIPQIFGALRYGVDVSTYHRLMAIYQHCEALDAFQKAHPDAQADAPGEKSDYQK